MAQLNLKAYKGLYILINLICMCSNYWLGDGGGSVSTFP